MSDFSIAILPLLKHEGGWVDDPNDSGGETAWGISMKWIQSQGLQPQDLDLPDFDPGCLHALTLDKAKELYRKYFWDPNKYDQLSDQRVANKIFDMCVNMGAHQAHLLAQRACVSCNHSTVIDGILGPNSIATINSIKPEEFIAALILKQRAFYYSLAAKNPKLQVFLGGWLKRSSWAG